MARASQTVCALLIIAFAVLAVNCSEKPTSPQNRPPRTPSEPSPAHGSITSTDVELSWTASDPEGDSLMFDIFFGTSCPPPTVSTDHRGTTYNPGELEYDQLYCWKVVAKDEHGRRTEGPEWVFTTVENQPPNLPSNPSPEDNAQDVPITTNLTWDASDPDTDSLYFDIFVGTATDPPWVGQQSDPFFKPVQDLEFGTDYYWKVIVKDEYDHETPGPVWHFKTGVNEPPDYPYDPVPEDGALDRTLDVTLRWKSGDHEGDLLLYDILLDPTDPPTSIVASDISELEFDAAGLLDYSATYYWQVLVRDDYGNKREGPVWHFTTVANRPPYPADNPSPQDGDIDITVDTGLRWTASDPEGDPLWYDVYLDTLSPPAECVARDITEREHAPGGLDYSTTYYWQVMSKDDYSNEREGPVWHFTTAANKPPDPPYDPSPDHDAVDVLPDAVLQWSGSDPENDVLTYDVYLGTDDPPSTLVAQGLTESWYNPPDDFDYQTTYYWLVVAKDDYDNEQEGPVWHFTTVANQPPDSPTDPSPSDGAVDVDLDAVLQWSGSDPEDDALSYDVYFGTDNPPATRVAEGQTASEYDPVGLEYTATYYWQVVVKDNHGNERQGPVWHFETHFLRVHISASGGGDVQHAVRSGGNWTIETINVGWPAEWFCPNSIAVDSEGAPHISFYSADANLTYAVRRGGIWTLEDVDTSGAMGRQNSLALDAQGHPQICYQDYTNKDLRYAYKQGDSWVIEIVDTAGWVGNDCSICIDGQGNPHVAYQDYAPNYDLRYATKSGGNWQILTVDADGITGQSASLALDTQGNRHICYYSDSQMFSFEGLKYARIVGGFVGITLLVDEGWECSLGLDDQDVPHVCYYENDDGDLKYAVRNGPWQIETVDSAGRAGEYCQLALDAKGNPHISYVNRETRELKYATKLDGAWIIETVKAYEYFEHTSIAVEE